MYKCKRCGYMDAAAKELKKCERCGEWVAELIHVKNGSWPFYDYIKLCIDCMRGNR